MQVLDYVFVCNSKINMFEFTVNVSIYQEVWEVRIGEILPCSYKGGSGNHKDPYAITVPSTWFYKNT